MPEQIQGHKTSMNKDACYVCGAQACRMWCLQPDFCSVQIWKLRYSCVHAQTTQHFHIPLTWSPYGYTTYRGS